MPSFRQPLAARKPTSGHPGRSRVPTTVAPIQFGTSEDRPHGLQGTNALISAGGINVAHCDAQRQTDMQARAVTIDNSPCSRALPDLEIPAINALAACLESEHRKFGRLIMRLAVAAARSSDDGTHGPPQPALELWSEIQRDLWPHLQIEDALVFSWGAEHRAIPPA